MTDIVKRLDLLAQGRHLDLTDLVCADAKAEIRRLRARNAELEAALKAYCDWADPVECGAPDLRPIREQMRAALAKAEDA